MGGHVAGSSGAGAGDHDAGLPLLGDGVGHEALRRGRVDGPLDWLEDAEQGPVEGVEALGEVGTRWSTRSGAAVSGPATTVSTSTRRQ